MKKTIYPIFLAVLALLISSFTFQTQEESSEWAKKVKWYTWEEAVKANAEHPKKFMVDIYTSWCGWCKVMDKKTFEKQNVADYLNEHFYPVKLNAEQKEDIIFNNNTFKFHKQGRRGVHTLAYSLLEGRMSYPSIVFLNEKFERAMISPGFKEADEFLVELEYINGEHYRTTHINEFKATKQDK
ncbi:MAG: DUF255 domain-containing protein [Bacteroidota bacterium]